MDILPSEVVYGISLDGINYDILPEVKSSNVSPKDRGKHIERFEQDFERQHVRYIKLNAKSIGKVPDWHEAAGSDTWVFIDEIIVQ